MTAAAEVTGLTPAGMAAEAARILAEVRQAEWPPSREAQWAIGWAVGEAADALADYYAVVNGETGPFLLGMPPGEWDGEPEEAAAAFAADKARECARAAARMLAEKIRGEEKGRGAEALRAGGSKS